MSVNERLEMFSKDYLTIKDLQVLLGIDYTTASKKIVEIKRKFDRLGIRGKIHIQDYLDYYQLPSDRYLSKEVKDATEGNKREQKSQK